MSDHKRHKVFIYYKNKYDYGEQTAEFTLKDYSNIKINKVVIKNDAGEVIFDRNRDDV